MLARLSRKSFQRDAHVFRLGSGLARQLQLSYALSAGGFPRTVYHHAHLSLRSLCLHAQYEPGR